MFHFDDGSTLVIGVRMVATIFDGFDGKDGRVRFGVALLPFHSSPAARAKRGATSVKRKAHL